MNKNKTENVCDACRAFIDSIKNEPWYSVDMDDAILEGWIHGMEYERTNR